MHANAPSQMLSGGQRTHNPNWPLLNLKVGITECRAKPVYRTRGNSSLLPWMLVAWLAPGLVPVGHPKNLSAEASCSSTKGLQGKESVGFSCCLPHTWPSTLALLGQSLSLRQILHQRNVVTLLKP